METLIIYSVHWLLNSMLGDIKNMKTIVDYGSENWKDLNPQIKKLYGIEWRCINLEIWEQKRKFLILAKVSRKDNMADLIFFCLTMKKKFAEYPEIKLK